MIPQEKIDQHAGRMGSLISLFSEQIFIEVDSIVTDLSTYMLKTLHVKDGKILQTPENSGSTLSTENVFQSLLSRSNFYPAILALVSSFVDQVDEFRDLHSSTFNFNLPESDHEILGNQAASAIGTIEGQVFRVSVELRGLLGRSLGESMLSSLVNEVTDVVRKLNRVEPIAKDQVMLWFRLFGHLTYKAVEESGQALAYSYVGAGETSREFCAKLAGGGRFSREEISAMDNGQMPDAFVNCGGHGCKHFWFAETT